MKLRGDYVPQKSAKTYATRGGICPQILRISHEYHFKAFKIVKKNQLVTGQKLRLDKDSGRNTKQNVHHHKISPKKWHDKSTRQKHHKKKNKEHRKTKKHTKSTTPKIQDPESAYFNIFRGVCSIHLLP